MPWRHIARGRRVITALLVPLAAFVAVASAGRRPPGRGPLESSAALLLSPLQSAVSAAGSWVGGIDLPLVGSAALRRENEQLRLEVERLRRELQESRELAAAAARLERLLEFRTSTDYPMTAASVIGRDASGLYRTVLIDRGSADGLSGQHAVLSPDGVVGRVIKVFPRSALVLLLTDRSSGIDAILQRTRDQGVVQGAGSGGCVLKYLDRSAEVEVGDLVVTSGLGGRFPKGMLVGQVSGITGGGDLFQNVEVRPAAALERLEEVWVVTGPPGERR